MALGIQRKLLSEKYVEAQVQAILSGILSICQPVKVYLFGSAAEGRFTDQSDLDFLIVIDEEKYIALEELKRIKKKWAHLQPIISHPVDVLWYTKELFEAKKSIGGVAMIAFEEGKLIYEGSAK